jgi:hypothetical protein
MMSDLARDFLDVTPKAQATQAKIDKWDFIKLQNCETINRVKRQPMEGRKYLQPHLMTGGYSDNTKNYHPVTKIK